MPVRAGCGELGSRWSDGASWWAGGWKRSILEVWSCGGAEDAQAVVHQDYKLRQGRTRWSACTWQVVFEELIAIMAEAYVRAAAALALQSDPWKRSPLAWRFLTESNVISRLDLLMRSLHLCRARAKPGPAAGQNHPPWTQFPTGKMECRAQTHAAHRCLFSYKYTMHRRGQRGFESFVRNSKILLWDWLGGIAKSE